MLFAYFLCLQTFLPHIQTFLFWTLGILLSYIILILFRIDPNIIPIKNNFENMDNELFLLLSTCYLMGLIVLSLIMFISRSIITIWCCCVQNPLFLCNSEFDLLRSDKIVIEFKTKQTQAIFSLFVFFANIVISNIVTLLSIMYISTDLRFLIFIPCYVILFIQLLALIFYYFKKCIKNIIAAKYEFDQSQVKHN